MKILMDICGWIGSALILIAYFMISNHRVNSKSYVYQWLNSIGSILLICNTLYYRTYPVATLNLIWLGIGITSLVRIHRNT